MKNESRTEMDAYKYASVMKSYNSSPWLVSLFFKMLSDAQNLHPLGLPDTVLQSVIDRHQEQINLLEPCLLVSLSDRQANGIQKIF